MADLRRSPRSARSHMSIVRRRRNCRRLPLSHHLQDSTHTSFGVVTTGLIVDRFKLEGSAFNGREPNSAGVFSSHFDSWSARPAWPPANWVAQYSFGRLVHPEALEPGNEKRQTASIEYNRPFRKGIGRRRGLGTDT